MAKLPKDIAIRVSGVTKDFHYARNRDNSIKHKAITLFRKKDKGFELNHALRGVTFDVKKGEFLGIVGRNGSGKSTLLKIISKIYQPTTGTADYRGKLVAFIELGVGFNPQLTGKDNVYLNAAMLGFSRKEIDTMYDDIVAFAELEKFMDLDLKNYSSGMKVRLAFSVAIRARADILVLDEVLAVGDAAFKQKCYQYFSQLKEEHKTIILVSHSMGLIKQYCDRAILIEGGKVVHNGSAEDIANAYNELFSSTSGADNKLGSTGVEIVDYKGRVTDKKINLEIGIRSERDISRAVLFARIDAARRVVAGANSLDLDPNKSIELKHGKTANIKIELDNNIGYSKFYVSFGLQSDDGSEKYGYWSKLLELENNATPRPVPVIMTGKIEVSG